MKQYGKKALSFAAAALLLVTMTGIAMAKTSTSSATDIKKLDSGITMIDKDASMPNGEKIVMDRITKEFKLKEDQIQTLRGKNMGLGEIAAVYAFADKMKGGVTEENVNKVVELRQGNKSWDQVAKSLDVKLGKIAKKVDSIEKDAHKDVMKAASEKPAGAGAGGTQGKTRDRY